MKFIKGCFVGLTLLMGSYANAAIITFDFSGTSANKIANSLVFNANGYLLTVTARAKFTDENGRHDLDAKVESFSQGLGVYSGKGDSKRLDNTANLQEELFFQLSSDLYPDVDFTWAEISFGKKWSSQLESGEKAQVRFGSPEDAVFINGSVASEQMMLSGSSTLISVKPGSGAEDNGFRVQQIALDVPEPTSLAVLSLGLLGLGARRFARKVK